MNGSVVYLMDKEHFLLLKKALHNLPFDGFTVFLYLGVHILESSEFSKIL